MEKIIIQSSQVDEALNKCKIQIETLLKTSQILFEKRKYEGSIAFSILAIEEHAKIGLLKTHLKSGKPIRENEWKAMKKHLKKLTIPIKKSVKGVSKMSPEKIKSANLVRKRLGFTSQFEQKDENASESLRMISILDQLKQDCFYLNVKDGKIFSIANNLSDAEQKALAYFLLTLAKVWIYVELWGIRNQTVTPQTLGSDPYLKKIQKINYERNLDKNKKLYFEGARVYAKYYNK